MFVMQEQERSMTMQQKSTRDQENERQWKQLQADRAREHQMQQIQHQGKKAGKTNELSSYRTDILSACLSHKSIYRQT